MFKVMLALVPGIAAHAFAFGPAILLQLTWCSLVAIGLEAIMLAWRNMPLKPFLTDGSALLTAWLFALSLPPNAPWWLSMVGLFFAIVVTKQLYGGLGNNLFNPAMVGFAVCMVSFPAQMSQWLSPLALQTHASGDVTLLHMLWHPAGLDGMTSATPLDHMKTSLHGGLEMAKALPAATLQQGWPWISLGYLVGGAWLIHQRVISWHIPVAVLGGFCTLASLLWLGDSSRFAPPWFHLQFGAVVLGAFFIATDPVSAPSTRKGKLIFAGLIGLLSYLIRVFGGYPDGVAFAVLLMNLCAPLLDHYTQPAVFGHRSRGQT